ncbi:MAG: serine/threonine protein kinase [Bradymonadales bacterium]|nr:serine/threonine protein kinase [Bradymonadales bacterium]
MQQEVFNGFQPGDVVDGRYEIVDTIGQGGFGIVYRARQVAIGRMVALKVLLPEADTVDPMAVERFKREAMLISSLESPNTITLIEFGQTRQGVLYTVMEFAKGITLRDMLAQQGKLPPERTVHIVRQVLTSLHEAHLRGIVHRDLKPANIMIGEFAGQKDHVKVLDFGIAKILKSGADTQSTLALTGRIVGTPKYMSPEQIRGVTPTPAADLYAMGLILYEMLTGVPAIQATEPMEQVEAQLRKEDITLPPNLPGVPSALVNVVNRALKKNATERFNSAEDFIQAMDGAISKQQVVGGLAAAVTVQRQAVVPVAGSSLNVGGQRIIGAPSATGATLAQPEEEGGSSLGPYLIVAVILFLVAAAGTVFMMIRSKSGGGASAPEGFDAALQQTGVGEPDAAMALAETDLPSSPGLEPDLGVAALGSPDQGVGEADAGVMQGAPDTVEEPVAYPVPPVEVPPPQEPSVAREIPPVEVTQPPVPPTQPVVPRTVEVEIVTSPSRARVTVGRDRVCSSTPCTIEVPADGSISARISRSGYESERVDISASDAPRIEVRLREREPEEEEIVPID